MEFNARDGAYRDRPSGHVSRHASLTHEELEGRAPLVDVCGQRRTEGRDESHVLAREDEGHVGAEAEEGVVLLSLLRSSYLRERTIAITITITIIKCAGPSGEKYKRGEERQCRYQYGRLSWRSCQEGQGEGMQYRHVLTQPSFAVNAISPSCRRPNCDVDWLSSLSAAK